jgi:hypothetical protein
MGELVHQYLNLQCRLEARKLQKRARQRVRLSWLRPSIRASRFCCLYVVETSKFEQHNRLEQKAAAALARSDYNTYDRLRENRTKLGEFRPFVRHSFYEQSPTIVFHYQLLRDYSTIEGLALKLLEELEAYSGE